MLEVNEESVDPEVENFSMWNVGKKFWLGTKVEQIHVHFLSEGDLDIATEEERHTQLKDDLIFRQVDSIDLGQEWRDQWLEDLELEVCGMVTKPNMGRRLDDYMCQEHLDRAVLELQTLD